MTASERRRVALAEAVAERWRRARIPYAVVHGLFGYPEGIGRDLDVAIGREHVRSAVGLALATAKEHGFGSTLFRRSHWGLYQLALIDPANGESLPIDFLCTTDVWRAKWVRLADERFIARLTRPDHCAGPFAVSTEGHFVKACVRPLLCGDLRHFAGEFPLPVTVPATVDPSRLRDLIGDYGLGLLGAASVDDLKAAFPAAMGRLQRDWMFRHPLGALRSLIDGLAGRARRRLFNAADVVFIETDSPEAVHRCLDELVPVMKRMFIELRPTLAGGVFATLWGAFHGWRQPPVSEFVVYAAILADGRSRGHARSRIECRAGRGRRALGADAVISASGIENRTVLRDGLRDQLLDFMAARHPPPRRTADRPLRNGSMMIAVLGPDGSGKSSLIDTLAGVPARPAMRFHLRPGVLSKRRDAARGPVSDPHGRPPWGPLVSTAKLLFLVADYVVGYWLVVRPALAAGKLVVFDRYFHDLLIDPRRYRYGGPPWLARMIGALVPRPDLWIILDAPEDVLQGRKRDVTAAETIRQREGYRKLAGTLSGAIVVNAARPAEHVAADVEHAIASHRAHEHRIRHGYEHR